MMSHADGKTNHFRATIKSTAKDYKFKMAKRQQFYSFVCDVGLTQPNLTHKQDIFIDI